MEAQAIRIQEMPRSREPLMVAEAPARHYGYLLGRLGLLPTSLFKAIEAFDPHTGRIWGMVGFDNWAPNSVEMHVVLDSPFAARVLFPAAMRKAFVEQRKGVAVGRVSSANAKALKFDKSMGFREVGRIPDAFDKGTDIIILALRAEDWLQSRWAKDGL